MKVDREGNVWFTLLEGHKVCKIDRKTGQLTEYDPPTPKAGPRRIKMDSKGRLWFTDEAASWEVGGGRGTEVPSEPRMWATERAV